MQQLLNGAIGWTVEYLGNGDPVSTVLLLLAAVAAAQAGNSLTGFLQDKWSKQQP